MPTPAPTRTSVLRYLLNELEEPEREQIDTLLISDADYAAEFQEVEYDLVDALAAGELQGIEKERAVQALGPQPRFSPQRSSASKRFHITSSVTKPRGAATRSSGVRWLALAALLLLAAGLARFAFSPASRRTGPVPALANNQTAIQPHPPTVDVEAGPPGPPPPSASSASPHALATLLLPGSTRSPAALHLRLNPDITAVQIDWPLPDDATPESRFQLRWVDDAGATACSTVGTTRHTPQGGLIRFRCNAQALPRGTGFVSIAEVSTPTDAPPLIETTVTLDKP